jgi:alkanesulfonate monooxygenase SsuD/methylene tetrahydromethanopterin reductase-like flavin-dependent oxidoreductase (luciferase family)
MAHALRFQVLTLPHMPWRELARRYRPVGELGFDVAGVADHFVDWTGSPNPWFEAWTLLAAIVWKTTHLRLAPAWPRSHFAARRCSPIRR